tara:strand:- start:256 stop:402 length:147 start_codon:yes stop_codon:yes gene_type:complete
MIYELRGWWFAKDKDGREVRCKTEEDAKKIAGIEEAPKKPKINKKEED